ncbi:MAG: hypothetical protein KDH18_05740, partial [Rhodoferax sp.]|nr:hypothetical protein [Rhodoferax sp.]
MMATSRNQKGCTGPTSGRSGAAETRTAPGWREPEKSAMQLQRRNHLRHGHEQIGLEPVVGHAEDR